MKLYHITKEGNLESILQRGILIGKQSHRKGIAVHGPLGQIYLTNDIDRILKTQAGEAWCKRWKPIVFEIDVSKIKYEPVKYHSGGTYVLSDFEYVVNENICIEDIKLV